MNRKKNVPLWPKTRWRTGSVGLGEMIQLFLTYGVDTVTFNYGPTMDPVCTEVVQWEGSHLHLDILTECSEPWKRTPHPYLLLRFTYDDIISIEFMPNREVVVEVAQGHPTGVSGTILTFKCEREGSEPDSFAYAS